MQQNFFSLRYRFQSISLPGWLRWLLKIFFLLLICTIFYITGFHHGQRLLPPVLLADRTPIKINPDDPGGQEIPFQDISVFKMVTGEKQPNKELTIRRTELPDTLKPSAPLSETVSKPAHKIESLVNKTAPKAKRLASPPSKRKKPDIVKEEKPAPIKGNFVIQLASQRTQELARKSLQKIAQKHKSLLSDYTLSIQSVDLGERGIFHRVQLHGFAKHETARNMCKQLAAAGQDCLVRRLKN